jgi:hypothetical protein
LKAGQGGGERVAELAPLRVGAGAIEALSHRARAVEHEEHVRRAGREVEATRHAPAHAGDFGDIGDVDHVDDGVGGGRDVGHEEARPGAAAWEGERGRERAEGERAAQG